MSVSDKKHLVLTPDITAVAHSKGSRRRRLLRGEEGFTLVEVLVVISIIGMVMALVGPRVLNYLGESKIKAAKIQIASFGSALDLFYMDTGRYPSNSEGLNALVQKPGNVTYWNGPYMVGTKVPLDPWGRPYVYRTPGDKVPYNILSYGAEGQNGAKGEAGYVKNTD